MLARIPPAQRRMVILTAVAAVAAGLFVAVAVVLASGRQVVRPEDYEPFVVAPAASLGPLIATDQPLFFADPTGGTRGFVLVLDDGDFLALHVIPPGGSAECPVDWNRGAKSLEDCADQTWAFAELHRFPTSIDEDGFVVVDLRRVLPPPAA